MGRQRSIRLSAIEESILRWEAGSTPWNGQLDVSAPRLDPERLRRAWNLALAHHPLASCAVEEDAAGWLWWRRADAPADIGPITVVECQDDAAVEAVRGEQLEERIPFDRPPLARTTIARRPHGDLLLSSVSHVLCDGVALLRLLRSVGRAYRGVPDPAPALDPLLARRALERPASTGLGDVARRWQTGLRLGATSVVPRDRVAQTGGPGPGCGVITRTVPAAAVQAARRTNGAAFDEHLVAAAHVAIDRWNRRAGVEPGTIGVAFGVNLRERAWVDDVVGNLAAFVSVLTSAGDRGDVATVLPVVRPQVERDARRRRAHAVVDAARAAGLVATPVRAAALQGVLPDLFDTFALSNCGHDHDPPRFEERFPSEVWISQPAVPQVGLAAALVTTGDDLRITVRYRREAFDPVSAGRFTDGFVAVLTEG